MKKLLALLLLSLALSMPFYANANDQTITYDFENTIIVDTADPTPFRVENGFHLSIWLGRLSACCTLGQPVSFCLDDISLEGYGTASFGLYCAYVDEESRIEVKCITESGEEFVSVLEIPSTELEFYTVKLPETNEKLVGFEIFVNSIPEDKSMFDVELEFLKFHKGSSVMLLSAKDAFCVKDGERSVLQTPAVIRDGSTLTPARLVAESFGANVEWIASERKVVITKNDITIELVIDSNVAKVNGVETPLASPACIIDGSTYTPARFVAENLLCNVGWDAQTKTVFIDGNK